MAARTTSLIAAAIESTDQPDGSGPEPERRTARRIAAAIGRMITAGTLDVGDRLPTVRELSRRLGVSPTTVSEAWRSLANVGAIETRGRNGTFVRQPTGPGGPRRYRQVTEGPGHFALDLSSGTPDPALLPDLAPIIARVSQQSLTSSYLDQPVLPELLTEIESTWPFPPEAMTVVDGALDALDRVATDVLRLGDRVIVEHPTFPPILDLLERLDCDVIGVDVDDEGLRLDQLRRALGSAGSGDRHAYTTAVALFLQPRAQNPAGISMSPRRAKAIAGILADQSLDGARTIVIEDDHSNSISSAPLVSVGRWLPARTVHIRSYSKSHGPDLRLAAIGGAGNVVTAVANRRLLGPGWSSRILQALLLELLRDPDTAITMTKARDAYSERRRIVSAVLSSRGINVTGNDGINLWMAVDDERSAVVALAARGIGVAPGGPFLVRPDDDHLRVTVGLISGGKERVVAIAEHLANAARSRSGRTGTRSSSHR